MHEKQWDSSENTTNKNIKTVVRKLRTMAETKREAIHRREYEKSTHRIKRSSKGRIEVSGKGFST
jgi:hypothetical protein